MADPVLIHAALPPELAALASRRSGAELEAITVRLDPSALAQIDGIAQALGARRSSVIRHLLHIGQNTVERQLKLAGVA